MNDSHQSPVEGPAGARSERGPHNAPEAATGPATQRDGASAAHTSPHGTPATATYRIEFGPAWPIPPITVDYSDRNQAARTVAAHAIPHLTPLLAEKGRPELADCFFHTDRELTAGHFMWLDLAGEQAARFCPARLKPTDLDPDICGDTNDSEVCERDPGHDGEHLTGDATVGWTNAYGQSGVSAR